MSIATRAELLAPPPTQTTSPPRQVDDRHTLTWRQTLLLALPGWLAAHLVVALALLAVAAAGHAGMQTGSAPGATGLLAWDGGWYRAIAVHGYGVLSPDMVRFFPLFPLLGHVLGSFGLPPAVGLVVLANACGLGFGMLVVRLAFAEIADIGTARRAAWLIQLVPGAGVLVLAYTEPLAGLLAAGFFLCLRRHRAGAVFALGVFSGLARPTGVFLAVAGMCALAGAQDRRQRIAGLSAIVAPVAGTVAYCGWVWLRFGDFALPYTAQAGAELRGGIVASPVHGLVANSHGGLDWRANIALVVVVVGLGVLAARKLPMRYVAWSAVMFAAAMTSARLHSLPRYCAALFPLLIALAAVLPRRRVNALVLAGCAVLSLVLTAVGVTPYYTP